MDPTARGSFLNASFISSLPNEETTSAPINPGSSLKTRPILYNLAPLLSMHLQHTCIHVCTHACIHMHECEHVYTWGHTHTPLLLLSVLTFTPCWALLTLE